MRINRYALGLIIMTGVLTSCYIEEETPTSEGVGFKPVYAPASEAGISVMPPRELNDPGKIYLYDRYLLVNEIGEGIHVFDNVDPAMPEPLVFISIPGNTEMAVRNNILYVNHLGSIAALTINDMTTIEQLASIPLQTSEGGVLPPKGFYFECIDPAQGMVVSWAMVERKNMDCYAMR